MKFNHSAPPSQKRSNFYEITFSSFSRLLCTPLPSPPPTNVSRQDFFSLVTNNKGRTAPPASKSSPQLKREPVRAARHNRFQLHRTPQRATWTPPLPPTAPAPPPPTPTTTSTPPLSTLDQQGSQLVINSFKTILLSLVSDSSTMHNKIWLHFWIQGQFFVLVSYHQFTLGSQKMSP